MNLILIIFLVADPLWTASAAIPAVAWVQDRSLVEELGNAVRDVIKAFTAKPAPPAALPTPVVNASEKEKQERRSRLQAYGNSMRLWLEPTCDLNEGQRDKLQKMLTKMLDDEGWWKARAGQANEQLMRNQVFGDSFPIVFTLKDGGVATKFQVGMTKSVSAELLAEEGQQRLQTAITERNEFHNNAFRDYVISILDRELYLTNEQRAKLVADFTSRVKFDHGMFSFQPQSYYLPYRPISEIVNAGNAVFGDEQRQRFRDLSASSGNRQQHLIFQSSDDVEMWYQQIEDASVAQRDMFLRSVAVRIAYYKAEMRISSEQSAHLLLAGKGAAELSLIDWKESTRLVIDRMQQQQQMALQRGNFGFGASKMSANDLERNSVWSESLNAILSNQLMKLADERDKVNDRARANAVLAMLDQELWLRPEQRPPVLELIENAFPRRSTRTRTESQDYLREIALLAQPLVKIPDEKINTVLNESQQSVWKQLKSPFRLQPGSNYLLVPTKNGNFGVQLYD